MIEDSKLPTKFCEPNLTTDVLRKMGYRNTSMAIASLIDNSIDAGAEDIVIFTLSERNRLGRGGRYVIKNIAILDNGKGMDLNSLSCCLSLGWGTKKNLRNVIGKFGHELLTASISQCKRVDVYSWREYRVYKTHFDVDDVKSQNSSLLQPVMKTEILDVVKQYFSQYIKKDGCLVLWSKLDKTDFTQSKNLFSQANETLSRIYRYFLADNDTLASRKNIMFCDIDLDKQAITNTFVLKANDPLYLLEPSNVPGANGESTNELYEDPYSINIEYQREKFSKVGLRFSIALPHTQAGQSGFYDVGHSVLGKHYLKNTGISFVRASREIDFGSFGFLKNSGDSRNRWWGAEVRFEPELDELFGVSNNKHQIHEFKRLDKRDNEAIETLQGIVEYKHNTCCFRARLNLTLSNHLDYKIGAMMSCIRKRHMPSRTRNETVKTKNLEKGEF